MTKEKEDEKYVCVTPVSFSKKGSVSFQESTILHSERLIVVKEQKKKVKR